MQYLVSARGLVVCVLGHFKILVFFNQTWQCECDLQVKIECYSISFTSNIINDKKYYTRLTKTQNIVPSKWIMLLMSWRKMKFICDFLIFLVCFIDVCNMHAPIMLYLCPRLYPFRPFYFNTQTFMFLRFQWLSLHCWCHFRPKVKMKKIICGTKVGLNALWGHTW